MKQTHHPQPSHLPTQCQTHSLTHTKWPKLTSTSPEKATSHQNGLPGQQAKDKTVTPCRAPCTFNHQNQRVPKSHPPMATLHNGKLGHEKDVTDILVSFTLKRTLTTLMLNHLSDSFSPRLHNTGEPRPATLDNYTSPNGQRGQEKRYLVKIYQNRLSLLSCFYGTQIVMVLFVCALVTKVVACLDLN